MGNRLHPRTLHGHAVPTGGVPDRARRGYRARGGDSHRRGIKKVERDGEERSRREFEDSTFSNAKGYACLLDFTTAPPQKYFTGLSWRCFWSNIPSAG